MGFGFWEITSILRSVSSVQLFLQQSVAVSQATDPVFPVFLRLLCRGQ